MFGFIKGAISNLIEGVKKKITEKEEPREEKGEREEEAETSRVPWKEEEARKGEVLIEEVKGVSGAGETRGIKRKEDVPTQTRVIHIQPKAEKTEKEKEKEREEVLIEKVEKIRETRAEKSGKKVEVETAREALKKPEAKKPESGKEELEIIKEYGKKLPGEEKVPKEEKLLKEEKVPKEKKGLKEGLVEKVKATIDRVRKGIEEKQIKEEDLRDLLWNFQLQLIQANVASDVAEKICEDVKKSLAGRSVRRTEEIEKIVLDAMRESIRNIFRVEPVDILKLARENRPCVIVFVGTNGSGKTLSVAKVAKFLMQNNFSSVFAAGDTFRASAIEQIEQHASNLGVKVIKHEYGADAAAVAYDAIEHAKARKIDTVLIDTAGRLHSNKALMDEMSKIVRVTKPHAIIFVGDALTGNDMVSQCEIFNNAVGITGLILTKVDVDEKGGAAISAVHTVKKPILFIGTGQGYDDFVRFNAEDFINKIVGG